jgi:hypothetical protein
MQTPQQQNFQDNRNPNFNKPSWKTERGGKVNFHVKVCLIILVTIYYIYIFDLFC